MFGKLHALMENSQLYTLKGEDLSNLREVTNCQFETRRLPQVFCEMRLGVMDVPGVTVCILL